MSMQKLPRGLLEIPKGTNTSCNDNSNFMNNLERTNKLLAQFVSATESGNKTVMRQELEESYFNLTMYNLKDSVKHKIEQDMWNNLFKKNISDLQNKIKNKDKLKSCKAQSEMSVFLDEAVGFYSKCIDTICLLYNIKLPGNEVNIKLPAKQLRNLEQPSEEDIRYIVQHIYVHMGDLSRYNNLLKQAQFYYELAVQLNPSSGHAYNQLAILESSLTTHSNLSAANYRHVIRTVLLYEYANTCSIPFPATRINLEALLRHISDQSVSTLLTSNHSIGELDQMCSVSLAWLHVYAHLKLCYNIQRCRQLQQRLLEWISELGKNYNECRKHWRTLVSLAAVHCSLLVSFGGQAELSENKLWSSNIHQFTQDILNALCRGFVSVSHDQKSMEELLSDPGYAGIIVVFFTFINRYLPDGCLSATPLKYPFGEEFIKFVNILSSKLKDTQSSSLPLSEPELSNEIKLPVQLPELEFLTGFQPLRVPCKSFPIFAQSSPSTNEIKDDISPAESRISFILMMCRRLAAVSNTLIVFQPITSTFSAIPVPEPVVTVKKYLKIEPSFSNKKPVNVALASMKIINNGAPNRSVATDESGIKPAVLDEQIARCIQEQIAQDCITPTLPAEHVSNALRVDSGPVIAPAPGLILSSSLPPDYKSITTAAAAAAAGANHHLVSSSSSVPMVPSSSISVSAPGELSSSDQSIINKNINKNHSYNPNREQFEKDLPPRFANKRSFPQLELTSAGDQAARNKGGFVSMNYWDCTTNDSSVSQSVSQFETNLTKKESEIVLPPTVPTSWLTDNTNTNPELMLDNNNQSMNFPFAPPTSGLMQQQHSFPGLTNPSQSSHMNMLQQSFGQYNQNQSVLGNKEQEFNALQYLLQSVTTNANTPRFRSQTDGTLSAHLNFDHSVPYLHHSNAPRITAPMVPLSQQQASINSHPAPKFPSIPPPTQNLLSTHLPQQMMTSTPNQNYDSSFQLTRSNFYDKPPVFSTSSNQSSAFAYSNTGSIMTQQQHQHQHQQQQQSLHHHQVRHNNPLLNLLPGFTNETQR